jgi:hypothetical protein
MYWLSQGVCGVPQTGPNVFWTLSALGYAKVRGNCRQSVGSGILRHALHKHCSLEVNMASRGVDPPVTLFPSYLVICFTCTCEGKVRAQDVWDFSQDVMQLEPGRGMRKQTLICSVHLQERLHLCTALGFLHAHTQIHTYIYIHAHVIIAPSTKPPHVRTCKQHSIHSVDRQHVVAGVVPANVASRVGLLERRR